MNWLELFFDSKTGEVAWGAFATLGTACGFILREWLRARDGESAKKLSREELFVKSLIERLEQVDRAVLSREERIEALEEKLSEKSNQVIEIQGELEQEIKKRQKLRQTFQEDILRAEEMQDLYRLIFNEGPLGIAIVNENLQYTVANQRFCNLLKREEKEILGQSVHAFIHPDSLPEGIRLSRQALRYPPGYYYTRTTIFLLPNGESTSVKLWVMRVNWTEDRHLLVLLDDWVR